MLRWGPPFCSFGDEITYNLDAQFANNEKGDDVFVKDQLEKEIIERIVPQIVSRLKKVLI